MIPLLDVLALLAAAVVSGQLGPFALAYASFSFALVASDGSPAARINPRLWDDAPRLVGELAAGLLIFGSFTAPDEQLGGLVRMAAVAVVMVLVGRALVYRVIREARERGFVIERTLIVGAGTRGQAIASTLLEHPEFGLVPVGFLDSFSDVDSTLPVLGEARDLEAIVREFGVARVIVAFGATREPEMVSILRTCDRLPVELHVLPRFFELGVAPAGPDAEDLWGIRLIRLRRSALRTARWRAKRLLDLAGASVFLLVSAPFFLLAAVAVRLSSHGPVFFRQKRISQQGRVFEMLKFRTMLVNGDADTTWSVEEDGRITRVGRILRRTSLDELPQLINVLKGEMSLVGPRPERPYFADRFRASVPRYDDRHRVPAGITGWAQVHGLRGDTSISERAIFDNHYIEHWSLWRDVVILARTVGQMVRGLRH